MVRDFRQAVVLALLLAALPASARAQQPGLEPVPQHGVLLLRNGQTIEGEIARLGDHYRVVVSNGEIRMRAADVELCCGSLEEGYRHKRGLMRVGDVFAHIDLAQWCLNNRLLGHAAKELADATDAEPSHPMVGVLRRRLQLALNPPEPPPPAAKPEDTSPSTEDLDRLIREMPPGTVETFTRTVQPLLANTCIASGCHGPSDRSQFRLQRISSTLPNRRTTQRNLYAALQWIDRQQPMSSRLLLAPLAPHGAADTPIITARQAVQWQEVSRWVCQVAGRPETTVSTAPIPQTPPLPDSGLPKGPAAEDAATDPTPVGATPAASPKLTHDGNKASAGLPTEGNIFAEADRMRKPAVRRGAQLKQFVPADPFDPEIFNRRFFPDRSQPAEQ